MTSSDSFDPTLIIVLVLLGAAAGALSWWLWPDDEWRIEDKDDDITPNIVWWRR